MKVIKIKAAFLAVTIFSATSIFAQDSSHLPKRDTTKMPKTDSTSMIDKKNLKLSGNTSFTDGALIYGDNKTTAIREKTPKKIG
jgi:hypothetical protein